MDFLKQHYEKILLSVILLGLALAAAWLIMAIEEAKKSIEVTVEGAGVAHPPKPADTSTNEIALAKAKSPPPLTITDGSDLLNPMTWKQRPDGTLIKFSTKSDAEALKLVKTEPLNYILAFDHKADGEAYYLAETREGTHKLPAPKIQRYAKPNVTNGVFVIRQARGADENTELSIELLDSKLFRGTNDFVVISKEKTYNYVEGYSADLKNDLDGKMFRDLRVGTNVVLGGEAYKIIAIDPNEVRVLAPNQKPITIRSNSGRP
jgi:hypothetical protein